MANNHVAHGRNRRLTAPQDLSSGDLFLVEGQLLVAQDDANSGDDVVGIPAEVFGELPATTSQSFTQFEPLFFDARNAELTNQPDDGIGPVAVAWDDKTASADTCVAKLQASNGPRIYRVDVDQQSESPSGTIDMQLTANAEEEVELVAVAYDSDMLVDSTISLSETGNGTEESGTDSERLYFKTDSSGDATLQATQDAAAAETNYIEIFPVNVDGKTYLEQLDFAG